MPKSTQTNRNRSTPHLMRVGKSMRVFGTGHIGRRMGKNTRLSDFETNRSKNHHTDPVRYNNIGDTGALDPSRNRHLATKARRA